MIPYLRKTFNSRFSEVTYRQLLQRLEEICGTHIDFRISETPLFVPARLMQSMETAGKEIVRQLMSNPSYRAAAERAVPYDFMVPRESANPMFVSVDFGITCNEGGEYLPKLIELQGFPTLYAFQPVLSEQYRQVYKLPDETRYLLTDMSLDDYQVLLRKAILGSHDPENVVLMELDPDTQKTRPDFILTERMCGVRTVNIRDLRKEGRQLCYIVDGKRMPIRRIYNRSIADELMKAGAVLPFSFRDDMEVEWAGHPNWFFRLSKFSLPFLDHPSVPRTYFVSELKDLPDDLHNWVLKPLYSFAGSGVIVGPSAVDIDAIPQDQRHRYILQEKITYAGMVETPFGPTKAEVRIMYIWIDDLCAVCSLVRMGRGKMMGVSFNKDMRWVGSSAGLYID
jgi:hypothetical protein